MKKRVEDEGEFRRMKKRVGKRMRESRGYHEVDGREHGDHEEDERDPEESREEQKRNPELLPGPGSSECRFRESTEQRWLHKWQSRRRRAKHGRHK
eukprot:2983468-Rhodomonas_salina.2